MLHIYNTVTDAQQHSIGPVCFSIMTPTYRLSIYLIKKKTDKMILIE